MPADNTVALLAEARGDPGAGDGVAGGDGDVLW